jgi:hypothetical protein
LNSDSANKLLFAGNEIVGINVGIKPHENKKANPWIGLPVARGVV